MDRIKSIGFLPMLFIKRGDFVEYLAHYDKDKNEKQLLNEHLSSVAELAYHQIPPTVEFDDIDNNVIKYVCYWTGHFHDLGKYSDYFQDYLRSGKDSRLKNHAHISACYLYNFISNNNNIEKLESQEVLFFLSYLCVRLHHTSIRSENLFSKDVWKELYKLENHLLSKTDDIYKDMNINDEISYEKFIEYFDIESLENDKRNFERIPIKFRNGRINDSKWYFLLIYIFSVLIDVDKLDSAVIEPKNINHISKTKVDDYLEQKHGKDKQTDLNNSREEVRQKMLSQIKNMDDDEIKETHFYTLTAPTGIGKTLSSFQTVLYLQERISEVEKYTPRIITAIPFINIIEQNKEEYKNVIGDSGTVVIHHRLSDYSLSEKDREEISVDRALLETESWEGDVVLTTFVQLFQSIFSGNNRLLKKINKLAGSIVILDEAQAVPEKYMPLIGATLQMISKYYGTRFILMTATQPKLLEFGNELLEMEGIKGIDDDQIVELLPNYEKYFKDLDRTKLVPLLENKINNDEFIDLFFKRYKEGKSALIVVNTIKRSIELFKGMKKEVKNRKLDVPVYYLSTNIVPKRRREVIGEVRSLLEKGKPVILVSTQTIEAGVDMDFDMGFRDFAPLDSLIQTAGRINREGKKGKYYPIYIVQLENDNHYIYNLSNRQSTMELLTEKKEILENEYGLLTETYYNLALERGVEDESKEIWEQGIMKLDFDVVEEFQMIDNLGEIADVYVEKDSRASNLADAYEAILNYEDELDYDFSLIFSKEIADKIKKKQDIFERKALLRLVMAKMNDYIVQVRITRLKNNRPIDFSARGDAMSDLLWVPYSQIKDFYDEETGFKDESGNAFMF